MFTLFLGSGVQICFEMVGCMDTPCLFELDYESKFTCRHEHLQHPPTHAHALMHTHLNFGVAVVDMWSIYHYYL